MTATRRIVSGLLTWWPSPNHRQISEEGFSKMRTLSLSAARPYSDFLCCNYALSNILTDAHSGDWRLDVGDSIPIEQEYQETGTPNLDCISVDKEKMLFSILEKKWKKERGITSSTSDMVAFPSYLRIIGMGESAVPLILAQLKREGDDPNHWFVALEAITGEDPVPEDAYGDTVRMAEAWLSWAAQSNAW